MYRMKIKTDFANWHPTKENEIALKNALSIDFSEAEIAEFTTGFGFTYLDAVANYYAEDFSVDEKREVLRWIYQVIIDMEEPNREETLTAIREELKSLFKVTHEDVKAEVSSFLNELLHSIGEIQKQLEKGADEDAYSQIYSYLEDIESIMHYKQYGTLSLKDLQNLLDEECNELASVGLGAKQ